MKKILIINLALVLLVAAPALSMAQSIADNLQMLVLDYQKLAGLKKVLQNMYSGYQVVSKGYNSVKDVSQGNYSLQEGFLNGLMLVSPGVRKYPKVAVIISDQATIIKEYKSAFAAFKTNNHFTANELDYMSGVFSNLFSQTLQNLDALSIVTTDNNVRMNDDQRIQIIDGIYNDTKEQLSFLRSFNDKAKALAIQRSGKEVEQAKLKQLYQIH